MAVHVRYTYLHSSLSSSAKQERVKTKFCDVSSPRNANNEG